ncbi:pyrroloquinoline quinone biosynthesis protein B [Breoghania corrubedonensis]|uniref:Coenzyme PQQ synthesis protein B n=1 Tax=Breoghania corrubedonensis TaxID=665038 RepID=A0A2T5VHQ7_9HYPH|nr:pyrroloquinoline quinone biosynthesis protein PqqB [Breoghania corrubedonensis]PTW63292.1 pyrroloquinoline quinone biosynthesis protein B [Breoghania corrubedonensis]
MKARVLGSAAGGGFPQWNCNAALSRAVRQGRPGLLARTQSSIATSADGKSWAVFNASPDIRSQIAANTVLQPDPDGEPRQTPIAAVVLTNADVDHIAGLLSLRERQPFTLYATARVLETLEANSIFRVLDPAIVVRRELPLGGTTELAGPDGLLGMKVETFPVPGKIALFLEDTGKKGFGSESGDTIGVAIRPSATNGAGGKTLLYVPGCARISDDLSQRIRDASCLMFDGTVFEDDEMRLAGVGEKTGARMGHMSISGASGSLNALRGVAVGRRIYVHINTTNPILEPGSAAECAVRQAGWEIGYDGMEIEL